jgi:hypothetical protein
MISLLALAIVLDSPAVLVPPPGPCDLLDKATVTAILGQPAPAGNPSGPEKDEDTGAMMTYCTYRAGQNALIVSRATFANAAAAKKVTSQEVVKEKMDDPKAMLVEEPGVGDRAFWATTSRGAQYMVLKDAVVVAIGFGGNLSKPPASYHDVLKSATTAAMAAAK